MTSELVEGWKILPIGELCLKIGSGATPRGGKSAYLDEGTALIRSQNVLDLDFSQEGLAHISEEAATKLAGATVKPGDVLLNITGDSVARCCICPPWLDDARVSQHVMIVRPDERLLNGRFLAYSLIAQKTKLLSLSTAGATRPALTKEMVSGFNLFLPEIEEQQRIAGVLGVLARKIELNAETSLTIEEIASAYWNELNRTGPRTELLSMAVQIKGSIQPSERPAEQFEQFSIPAFDEGRNPEFCLGSTMASGKTPLPTTKSVLVSKLNPTTWRAWLVHPSGMGEPVCSPEFVALSSEDDSDFRWLAGSVLFDQAFRTEVVSHSTGTTGSRQRIKPADLLGCSIPEPDKERQEKWDLLARPMFEELAYLKRQSMTLSSLRSELIVGLTTGKVRVPDSRDLSEVFDRLSKHRSELPPATETEPASASLAGVEG